MFSFVTFYVPPRGWLASGGFPLHMEAKQAFGAPSVATQGYEKTYFWAGMYAWIKGSEVIWTATEDDKILWLQMNMPSRATILDT